MFIRFQHFCNTPFNIDAYRLATTEEERAVFADFFEALGFKETPHTIVLDAATLRLQLEFSHSKTLVIPAPHMEEHWSDYALGDHQIRADRVLILLKESVTKGSMVRKTNARVGVVA